MKIKKTLLLKNLNLTPGTILFVTKNMYFFIVKLMHKPVLCMIHEDIQKQK